MVVYGYFQVSAEKQDIENNKIGSYTKPMIKKLNQTNL